MAPYRIPQIEDYEPFIGIENVERIREKARKFKGLRIANFNSTYYGGGVAETISSLTLLLNSLGLRTEWRVIQGTADFFSITKKMHNALQGGEIDLSSIKKEIYEQVIYENSVRNFLEHDFVIVHDPQPLPFIEHYKIPIDLPLVVQISRFDPWKDPEGVVEAFKLARKKVDARLVLLGNFATDDPEGREIFESLCACEGEHILILTSGDDTALVNALQTRAAVVLQKSLREGFGLTVAEAMWKSRAVIGGHVGGIRYQIEDGVDGFLVSSNEQAAERIVRLLKDEKLREEMGRKARETVRKKFLLTRYAEEYLDLFGALDKNFHMQE